MSLLGSKLRLLIFWTFLGQIFAIDMGGGGGGEKIIIIINYTTYYRPK